METAPVIKRSRLACALLCVGALSCGLLGCGSAQVRESPAAKLCKPQARALVARTLALPGARVATAPGTGNNGMPQCSFKARLAVGGGVEITVNVDTSPQPYAVLSRTIVEGQQVFSPTRLTPAPVAVMNLGLLASWFPNYKQLMSTEGVRLLTTTVIWPRAKQGQEIALATKISRLYLGRPQPKLAKLFP